MIGRYTFAYGFSSSIGGIVDRRENDERYRLLVHMSINDMAESETLDAKFVHGGLGRVMA